MLDQVVRFKLSQRIENASKVQMEVITPVVTEDIVTYLLQNIDENNKFSKLHRLVISEANLRTAWLEIKNKFNILKKLPAKWFKETNGLLMQEKYNYKALRVVKIPEKKNSKSRKLVLTNPYDRIVQKAFHRVLNVIFEGHSEWEKTDKKTFQGYSKIANYTQVLKKKNNNEY